MPDVTDSYCERCGARYVFNPNAVKGLSLKGARVLAKGLKNFVLTDGQSMADSLAMARHDDDHEDSSKLTEAFHRTFNFCLTCRQYACDKCWNVRVGSCFTCAPENGYAPAAQQDFSPDFRQAPQEPMAANTPVPDWETSWSVFAEGASAESKDAPAPTRFNEPIVFSDSDPAATPKSAGAPNHAATPKPAAEPAWPLMDLPDVATAAATGANGKNSHRAPHKQGDQAAASLWPITDAIAPEMTLTPEELELVESSLGQGETVGEISAVVEAAPEPQLFEAPVEAPAAAWTPAEPLFTEPAAAAWTPAEPLFTEPAAAETASPATWGASWRTASPSPWDTRTASAPDHSDAAPPMPLPAPLAEPIHEQAAPVARLPEPAEQPQRILRMPMPSQARPDIRPPEHARSPIVAKLLGRHGGPHRDQAAASTWPRATAWAERPIKAPDWAASETVAPAPAAPAPAIPFPVPAAAFAASVAPSAPAATPAYDNPVPAQIPFRSDRGDADARSAAAVRLSAASGNDSYQPLVPADPPLFTIQPVAPAALSTPPVAPEPAWPESDRDVVEAAQPRQEQAPDLSQQRQATPPLPGQQVQPGPADAGPADAGPADAGPADAGPAAPSPWPPLGASWPAREEPGAPWPGPDMAPVPAAMAAQAAPEPTITEMWAQSSQEVLNRGTVRVCQRCALPVSTQARFCRRCGTRQA
jgi:ribosomal protein L40E